MASASAPDFRSMLRVASLADVANSSFNCRHIGKPEWRRLIVENLEHDPSTLSQNLSDADPMTLDFFLWNYLAARNDLCCPHLLDEPSIGSDILRVARTADNNRDHLAGICGTLHLCNWQRVDELRPLLDAKLTLAHCLRVASAKTPRLIRMVAALACLKLPTIDRSAHGAIKDGVDSLVFSYKIQSQALAVAQVRKWLEAMSVEQ